MSIGPSTLGNLLVHRLDSVLGISQTTQHRTGAHPDALRQTQSMQRLIQGDNPATRSSRESVDRAKEGDSTRVQNRADARLESQLQKYTDNRFTPSAPTTLGRTARTILALLTQYAHQPVQGQRPLLSGQLQQSHAQNTPQGTATHTHTANTTPAASPNQANPNVAASARAALSATLNPTPSNSAQAQLNTTPTLSSATATAGTQASATPSSPLSLITQILAQSLQQSVQQSGLFYEAKLAQLVKGQISAESLQQQPQAQAHQQRAQPSPSVMQQLAGATAQSADAPTQSLQQSGIEPSTQQLVRQQLEVLANQVFNWRGEAWPGVPLELDIERHQPDEDEDPANANDAEDTPWQTRLKLQLPSLGDIQARLHIHDNTVRLHIEAPESADRLKQNLAGLVNRLEAQGIQIQQLQIVREDDSYLAPPDPYYDQNHPY